MSEREREKKRERKISGDRKTGIKKNFLPCWFVWSRSAWRILISPLASKCDETPITELKS